jgi:hypothetical protein
MTYLRKNDYIPITVAYKKKYGKKVYIETFTDQRTPDRILSTRSKILPKDCEILDLGVGKSFIETYKKKYL